jgi:imidazolonepropionase-like amidohydrolase
MKTISRALLPLVLLAVGLRADAPNVFAIRGARVVTAAGAPMESATIVIRRGVIEAIGPSIAAPDDATIIEGRGFIVYPGLIDLGNTRVSEQPIPQTPQNMRSTAELERWKRSQILKPQSRAADAFKVDDAELAKMAAAGITSVLAVPSGDVIAGQSALVNVAGPPDEPQIGNVVGDRRALVVVKTPIALHVSFPERPRPGANAYPQSLMGVIAFVRQSFLDAQRYALHPADDPALAAMVPAVERKLPVAFQANEAREILRALKLARELKLDAVITGGLESTETVQELKSQSTRVIYSLNFPQRSRSVDPEADESIHTLRKRADAPKTPGDLAKAGIPFAFESAGLSDPKDFVKNAVKVVKAGLPADAAIRALTIGAATIAGAADRLGSLEKGKAANLIVTDGDLFDEKSTVKHVFVEGRPVSLTAAPSAPPKGKN